MKTKTLLAGIAFFTAFAAVSALAQAPQMVRVRGTIESVDGPMLSVKSRDGEMMKLKLADNAPVNEVVKIALADIKQGSFIAITAMPQPDGSQKATAIIIFPEAMRGVGEGHRPWDFVPNSTMTNATVDSTVDRSRWRKISREIQGRREDGDRHADHRNRHLCQEKHGGSQTGRKGLRSRGEETRGWHAGGAEYLIRQLCSLAVRRTSSVGA